MRRMFCLPAVMLALVLALTACSGGGKSASFAEPMAPPSAPMAKDSSARGELGLTEIQAQASPTPHPASSGGGQVYTDENAKLIREAHLTLQTQEFDAAVAALEQLVAAQKGYYQQSQVQGGEYYDANATRYGEYTVRIPKGCYDAFLDAAGTVAHVVSRSESTTDVGEAYFDAEHRLKTQQTKQTRLQALLEQAESMEAIVALESALADTEYQIELYATELRRYDALVDYATIHIGLSEVLRLDATPGEAAPLGTRVASAFRQGFVGFGQALDGFTVWAAYHFISLLVVAAAVVVAALVVRSLRHRRHRARRHALQDPPPPTPEAPGPTQAEGPQAPQ